MKIDYYTLLCAEPISLSIGTARQPSLREIGKITFIKYGLFQVYMKLTPEIYYTKINTEKGKFYWDTLTDEIKENMSLYDLILLEEDVLDTYLDLLNFFFVERVIFDGNSFLFIDTKDYISPPSHIEINENNLKGIVNSETFLDVLDILQQICCIKDDDVLNEKEPKFKNEKARRLWERMLKAKKEREKRLSEKDYYNHTLPNIISATAAKCAGLNIINIWDATPFQLYDQFNKTRNDDVHYINSVRVAVWGDEKNLFDPSLWYKNNYDNQTD